MLPPGKSIESSAKAPASSSRQGRTFLRIMWRRAAGKFGGDLTLTVELYETAGCEARGSFTSKSGMRTASSRISIRTPSLFFKSASGRRRLRRAEKSGYLADHGSGRKSRPPDAHSGFRRAEWSLSFRAGLRICRTWSSKLTACGRTPVKTVFAREHSYESIAPCYETVLFKTGIQRGKTVLFPVRSCLRNAACGFRRKRITRPRRFPMWVNGVKVGETPFTGDVPLCAPVEVGDSREHVPVALRHNGSAEYTVRIGEESKAGASSAVRKSSALLAALMPR